MGIVSVLSACSGATGSGQAATPVPSSVSAAEFEALYRARQDSAKMRFVEADVRFMTGMIGHHSQAILMSRLAPARAGSGSIRTLAARIINAQNDEIGLMQQWLRERGQAVPEVHVDEANLALHGPDHVMNMPGMLTPAQLAQLEQARGAEFDRLFLAFMIQHHQGAVKMVHELFATHGAGQEDIVFKLASDVQVDQITEIARMEKMLAAMPAGRTP